MTMKLPPATSTQPAPAADLGPSRAGEGPAARTGGSAQGLDGPDAQQRLAEPPLPPASPSGGGIAGPVAIGVGLGVLAMFGGASHPASDPAVLAPVLNALSGLGQLVIAGVVAGVVYVGVKTAGAPLPTENATDASPSPPRVD